MFVDRCVNLPEHAPCRPVAVAVVVEVAVLVGAVKRDHALLEEPLARPVVLRFILHVAVKGAHHQTFLPCRQLCRHLERRALCGVVFLLVLRLKIRGHTLWGNEIS